MPGDTPHLDTNLRADEIITEIELPAKGFARNYTYLKIRDRLSYAFALVSVAVVLQLDGDRISEARLALGGVTPKPWRNPEAESWLSGKPASRENFLRAAETILRDARGFGHNDFKIELARRPRPPHLVSARGAGDDVALRRLSGKPGQLVEAPLRLPERRARL